MCETSSIVFPPLEDLLAGPYPRLESAFLGYKHDGSPLPCFSISVVIIFGPRETPLVPK